MQTQTLTMAKLVLQRRRKSSTKKPKTLRLPLRSVERLFTMMAGVCWRRVFVVGIHAPAVYACVFVPDVAPLSEFNHNGFGSS